MPPWPPPWPPPFGVGTSWQDVPNISMVTLSRGSFQCRSLDEGKRTILPSILIPQPRPATSSLLLKTRACRAGPFVVNPNGSTYSYFMSTLDPVAQALVPHILTLDNSDDGEAHTGSQASCSLCMGRSWRALVPTSIARHPSILRCSAPRCLEALASTDAWFAGEAAVNSGQALAYLSDYSTLQYYQTQLNCRLEVWPIISASLQGHAHTVFLPTVISCPNTRSLMQPCMQHAARPISHARSKSMHTPWPLACKLDLTCDLLAMHAAASDCHYRRQIACIHDAVCDTSAALSALTNV